MEAIVIIAPAFAIFFFSEIVLISFILSRTHFLFAFLLRTWLKLRLSDYDYDLTPLLRTAGKAPDPP